MALLRHSSFFYRRLDEFFFPRPKEERFSDNLRAYKFGFEELEPFLCEDDRDELHERAAHPTFREADHGKVSYEIYSTSWLGLRHGLRFMDFLKTNLFADIPEKVKDVDIFTKAILSIWEAWSSEIPEKDRRTLN